MEKCSQMCQNIKLSWTSLIYPGISQICMSLLDFITDILAGLELFGVVSTFLSSTDNTDIHVIWGSLTFVFVVIPGLMVAMQVLSLYIMKRKITMLTANGLEI